MRLWLEYRQTSLRDMQLVVVMLADSEMCTTDSMVQQNAW